MQSKKMSMIEIVTGQIVAILVSWGIQIAIFPLFDIKISNEKSLVIVLIFAASSMLRSYLWRRLFNGFKNS